MKVLITGGAGFIGSHTCITLLEKGYEIIVLDSYINSNIESLNRVKSIIKSHQIGSNFFIKIFRADLRDEKILNDIFLEAQRSDNPIRAVLHFAGLKSVKDSVVNPLKYWDANLNSTIKLLNVMDKFNCRTIVFSSSATIYGRISSRTLLEDTEINPINPYGNTKYVIEKLLNDIYKSKPNKWKIANLRYFNPIGAHPSGKIGEEPIGLPNNIFPFITKVAAGQIEKVKIFGKDWETNDGTGVRDYIHIMDLAEGHLLALEYLINNKEQIINLNIGTGKGTSVLELINTFKSTNKIDIPYEFSSRREGDVASLVADNSLAMSCLNWSPKRTLKQMCLDGWRWQSLNPKGYN